jgi:hypothetical protein
VEKATAQEIAAAGGRPIKELLTASDDEKLAAMRSAYEGTFGKLTAKLHHAGGRAGEIGADGKVFDVRGREVGHFSRSSYVDDQGNVWIAHGVLEIDAKVQGSGFAAEFNAHAMDWYRGAGVHGIYLSAVDIGKYAWAAQGFEFTELSAQHVIRNLRELVENLRAGRLKNRFGEAIPVKIRSLQDLDAQLSLAESVIERAQRFQYGDAEYPSAYEISQLGRARGQGGKSAIWLGKYLMLNSAWDGVMLL